MFKTNSSTKKKNESDFVNQITNDSKTELPDGPDDFFRLHVALPVELLASPFSSFDVADALVSIGTAAVSPSFPSIDDVAIVSVNEMQ